MKAWFAIVCALVLAAVSTVRAQVANVRFSVSSAIVDFAQNPATSNASRETNATARPDVLTARTASLTNAFGSGTGTATATGRVGSLHCRSAAGFGYFVPSRTEGGYSGSTASIQVTDYITVTSSTLSAGTVVALSMRMALRGVVSAPWTDQTRPGISAYLYAGMSASSSVDNQIHNATYPNKPLEDSTFTINAKVGETFLFRYEIEAGTRLDSNIPDYRSVTTDFYGSDYGAYVTVTPMDPANVGFVAASGYDYAAPTAPGAASIAAPFVVETAAELAGSLDADADGRLDFLAVEKATGVRRLGIQQADGSFVWAEPASTGVEDVAGLGIGRFAESGTADGFAVVSPTANRVLLFNDAAGAPVVVPSVGIGPNLAVGFNFAGDAADDLAIATKWDGAPSSFHLSGIYRNVGVLGPIYGPHEESGALSRGNRARFKTGRPWMLGALQETPSGRDFIVRPIFGFPGFADGPTLSGLAAATEWAWGEFSTNDFASFLFYTPGHPELFVPGIAEPLPYQFGWTAGNTYNLGRPVARVLVVSKPSGAFLLVVFGDETTASLYDFDGVHAPVERQALTAPPGSSFSVAGALGNGEFVALAGPVGGAGASTTWQHWGFDGTRHNVVASGALPGLSISQGRADVLLFGSDPGLNQDAPFLGSLRIGDWSDAAVPTGTALRVTNERFLGTVPGLGNPISTDVSTVVSGLYPVVNQRSAIESVAVLAPPASVSFPDLAFSPAPGAYHTDPGSALEIHIVAASGGPVLYRTNQAAAWLTYSAENPPRITATTTFSAYASGTPPGAIRTATYTIADAPTVAVGPVVDANHNGIPDAWEKAFGVSDPNADPDGDGATNLQEYLAGTDPLDAASVPAPEVRTVVLVVRFPSPGAPDGTFCEIAWPATISPVVLESTSDLGDASSWAPASGSEATVGSERVHYEPLVAGREARYYRLRGN